MYKGLFEPEDQIYLQNLLTHGIVSYNSTIRGPNAIVEDDLESSSKAKGLPPIKLQQSKRSLKKLPTDDAMSKKVENPQVVLTQDIENFMAMYVQPYSVDPVDKKHCHKNNDEHDHQWEGRPFVIRTSDGNPLAVDRNQV